MQTILIFGIIIICGFIFGEIATRFKFPKVTGYILAGVLLNPDLFNIIPRHFIDASAPITNMALAFITFSIGGTLLRSRLKRLGTSIVSITICEAEFAFLAVGLGLIAVTPFFIHIEGATSYAVFIPLSLLLASLASPTDPSVTLAVEHEYKAKGDVSSTIMGVAAFDDVTGIINYSLAVLAAEVLILHKAFSPAHSILNALIVICGGVLLGIIFGFLFNRITMFIKRETEGVLIVAIAGFLALSFGIARLLGINELLATMTMGIVVVNFNPQSDKIFKMLERYTEELIFVLFFALCGMHLKFDVFSKSLSLIFIFVLLRAAGKFIGTIIGATLSHSSPAVRKYTFGGLLPQGGIVVGLALMMKQNHIFDGISDIVISIIIGTTIIHEFIGPIFTKMVLRKAGEIRP